MTKSESGDPGKVEPNYLYQSGLKQGRAERVEVVDHIYVIGVLDNLFYFEIESVFLYVLTCPSTKYRDFAPWSRKTDLRTSMLIFAYHASLLKVTIISI